MSKISTEGLDFDDITGKTSETITQATKPVEETQPKETKSSENDYQLAIRLSYDSFQLITLETCTPAEFFQCMSQCYPYMGDQEPEEVFATRQARVRTLKHVVSFHSDVFKPLRTAGQVLKKEQKKPLSN